MYRSMLTEILKTLSQTDFPKSSGSSTGRLLFDIQMWLLSKRVLVEVTAIDSWNSFRYRIAFEDAMSPFFEPDYDKFNESQTYEAALEAGIHSALKLIK